MTGAVGLLVTSLVALACAPVLHHLASRASAGLAALEGFVVVGVGGLVLLHVLPDALSAGGPWVLLATVAGLAGPRWLESQLRRAANRVHTAALVLALIGLALHGLLDGFALGAGTEKELAVAVILHRMPVGLSVWWLLAPVYGTRGAATTLLVLAVASVVGFGAAFSGFQLGDGPAMAWFSALVAGTLVHVILHRPHDHTVPHDHDAAPGHHHEAAAPDARASLARWTGAGIALLGILIPWVLHALEDLGS